MSLDSSNVKKISSSWDDNADSIWQKDAGTTLHPVTKRNINQTKMSVNVAPTTLV